MGYAVYHSSKGGGSGSGLGHHIERTKGKEHLFKNAKEELRYLNKSIDYTKYCKMPFHKGIRQRIEDGYKGERAIRKDAVKYIGHMLGGSNKDMLKIWEDPEKADRWVKANYKFIADNFGAENIVRFTIHRDETTPHIHCVTVPITKDGRLSAKEMVGNNKKLRETQTIYANYMQEFGLERGREYSGATHTEVKEYYEDIKEELEERAGIIKDLENQEQELRSEINSLTWKDRLGNAFNPRKLEKEQQKEINELTKKLSIVRGRLNESFEVMIEQNDKLKKVDNSKDTLIKDLKIKIEKLNRAPFQVVEIINNKLKKQGNYKGFEIVGREIKDIDLLAEKKEEKQQNRSKGMGI